MYRRGSKRIFDFVASIILLVMLSPLLIIIYLSVRIFLGAPVIFTQLRPGLNEQPFKLFKFRTMLDIRGDDNQLLDDEYRLTRFGKLLRSLSIDELPELINVISGEMSLVGPRPLLMDYLPHYTAEQRKRHQVRPGITGWAQINGRNTLNWPDKFLLDIWYIENYSFMLDCKILWMTFYKIIHREGIHAPGVATMTRFDLESHTKGRQ